MFGIKLHGKKRTRNCENKIANAQITFYKYLLDEKIIEEVKERFIAIDVETTGLTPWEDKIVEIGAVLFEYGIPVKSFSTLVNPRKSISESASRVNHITDRMIRKAPSEEKVYKEFVEFLGDALYGKIYVCAHNADFDMLFLSEALRRMGYSGDIYCLDTLDLSRKIVKNLSSYKLNSVAKYFEIENKNEHRAKEDAEVSGNILVSLIYELNNANQLIDEKRINIYPNPQEINICKYIKNMINKKGGDTELIRFKRKKGNLVEILYFYGFLEFSAKNEKIYILVEKEYAEKKKLQTELANKIEGTANARYIISDMQEIDVLEEYIYEKYQKAKRNAEEYMSSSVHHYKKAMSEMNIWIAL